MLQAKNVFILGIKGVGMANLAIILKKMGKNVCGTDLGEEYMTDVSLKNSKIQVFEGFETSLLSSEIDLVIYSAAHNGMNNPLIIEAKKKGIKVLHQAEVLGELTRQFKNSLAICGCHGKTTTTSLLAYALKKLGAKPSYFVGSSSFGEFPAGEFESKDYFVVEADEYGMNPPLNKTPKFHFLNPTHILATNIDFDHPDVYENIEETKAAYLKFFEKLVDSQKKLIFCADDQNLMEVAAKLPRQSYVTYGYSEKADLRIFNFNQSGGLSHFFSRQDHLYSLIENEFEISLFGEKNVSNAAGVILMLLNLGFEIEEIKKAIQGFTGAKRRFEKRFSVNNIELYDDYGHHPNEIKATISAARDRFPHSRIIVIFQPHTFSRTQALLVDFAQVLSLADYSFILPIFASARENKEQFKVTSKNIEEKANKKEVRAVENNQEIIAQLEHLVKPGDVIITMGAGDVYKIENDIISIISKLKC